MKKFTINILIKMILLIFVIGLNIIFNIVAIKSVNIYKKDNFFVFGDSHSRHALNPKLISKYCANYSQGAEPLSLSYFKIENVIKRTEVDTIILSFSPHNIAEFNDQKLVNRKWSSALMQRAYSLNIHKYEGLIDKNELNKARLSNMGLFPKLYHDDFLGHYEPLDSKFSSLSETRLMETIKKHYGVNPENSKVVSKVQLSYLKKIVSLCNRNNVQLILWCSPLHRDYLARVPDQIMEEYKRVLNSYAFTLNFTEMTLDDSSFRDHDHLNEEGASLVSNAVRSSLNNKLFYDK